MFFECLVASILTTCPGPGEKGVCIEASCTDTLCKISMQDPQTKEVLPWSNFAFFPAIFKTGSVSDKGSTFTLADGSIWKVISAKKVVEKWGSKDKILLHLDDQHNEYLANESKKQTVQVNFDSPAFFKNQESVKTVSVLSLDEKDQTLCLSDGTCWTYHKESLPMPLESAKAIFKPGKKVLIARNGSTSAQEFPVMILTLPDKHTLPLNLK